MWLPEVGPFGAILRKGGRPGIRKNGDVFPTEVGAQLFMLGDSQVALVHVHDITARKPPEDERKRLAAQDQRRGSRVSAR